MRNGWSFGQNRARLFCLRMPENISDAALLTLSMKGKNNQNKKLFRTAAARGEVFEHRRVEIVFADRTSDDGFFFPCANLEDLGRAPVWLHLG